MSYRGGRYSSGNRRGNNNNNNFRNQGRRDSGGSSGGFRDRSGGRSRDFDSRRRVGNGGNNNDRRRDDFKRYDDRRDRRDSFGSNSGRGMKRKFRDQSPRRRSNDFQFERNRDDSKDFRRRGLDNRRNNRGGPNRRGSYQSNDRRGSSSRHRSRSGNSDRDKMPPPMVPRNLQRNLRGGMDRRRTLGGGIRRDTNMSLVHKRLAEKHGRRDRAREVINKRIKMAKMRSTLNTRQRPTKLGGARLAAMKRSAKLTGKGGVRAAVVAKKKKVSESGDKDTADEVWDEDEKQIHEEEMAAKKAAEALHESNSGDDATKKAQDTTAVKVKKERTESTSEHDTKSTESKKRVALNLTCVHCKSECQTALEYKAHLDGKLHRLALRKAETKQQGILQRMRISQRNAQKEADEGVEKDSRSKHCQTCRLFYKQTREEHQASEDHLSIKKFLFPYCSVCKISCNGIMDFEIHRSSVIHLRNKANYGRSGKIPEDDEEEIEVDLDNFSTVDEVGDDGDEENDIGSESHADEDKEEDYSDEEPSDVNVGSEHIKEVLSSFCSLCHIYISHQKNVEKSIKRHCVMRTHLRNYIRYKDNLVFREEQREKQAKRKERREAKIIAAAMAAMENGKDEKKEGEVKKEDEKEATNEKETTDTASEDKEESMVTDSAATENGDDTLDISIKKEKDDSFIAQEEDEGVTA